VADIVAEIVEQYRRTAAAAPGETGGAGAS
jgi:hypothetical protein